MTKLCPRGKAAAKRKFKVYPSAYANAYASKICAGKIKDPSGVKRKDFKGPKPKTANKGDLITDDSLLKKQKQFENAKVKGVNDSFINKYKKLEKEYKEKLRKNQGSKTGTKKKALRKFFPYEGPGTRVIRPDGTSTLYPPTPEGKALYNKENPEGFNVGGHSVMGSPVSVDVDGDTLSNPSASAYYKDLLK
mgnify:CR=1 FL=1|tara:strand:+ start:526 stop:1101 length:576 start_codon:yes stop_codon:yes gene_type:complete